jgi:hypothetical protein
MDAVAAQASFRPDVIAPPNDDIRATVEQVEAITLWTPRAILVVFVGLPILVGLSAGIGWAVICGIFYYLFARLLIAGTRIMIIRPMTTARYKAAAQTLGRQLRALPEPTSLSAAWWQERPGAAAVTGHGHVVIATYDTGYQQRWLTVGQIVDVSVERDATVFTDTREGGRFTFGGFSGNLFGGFTTGARANSVSTTVETAFLEVRYQLERNGSVQTCVVPFGNDRRGADEWRAMIGRLEPAA